MAEIRKSASQFATVVVLIALLRMRSGKLSLITSQQPDRDERPLYLQQPVCLLPARDRLVREVGRLLARVRAEGGAGQVLTIAVPEQQEYEALTAQFNAARDAEYAEVLQWTPQLLAEIDIEASRGRASYAEVEESEADLDRFRTWLGKITARDYFDAPGRAAAETAVANCAEALEEFEVTALPAETGTGAAPAEPNRLTVVDGG